MRAGAAERNVTPPVGCMITHPPRESVGVHDPLFVRAMVLDDEAGTSVAIICCDLIGCGFEVFEQLAERVRSELGIEHLLINFSHPHSSIGLGPRPAEESDLADAAKHNEAIHDAIMEMLAEARDAAVSVTLKAGRAPAQVGFNRRIVKDDGFVTMGPNRDGPAVPWVNVLIAEAADTGKSVAVLFQHTAHPVIVPDTSCLISADFPGAAVARVREELGDDVVALFGQGCCGNINGFPLRTTHENATKAGRELGEAALEAMRNATPITAEKISFAVAHAELPACELPSMEVWQETVDHITAMFERGDNPWLPKDVYDGRMKGFENLRGVIERGQAPPPWRMDVYALMLGSEWCLTAMPNEMFCQYELWIDEAAPFERTMTFGYTNGGAGYIAVDEAWARGEQGGYEAAYLPNWGGCCTGSRHFGPPAVGGEQIIKDTIAAAWASRQLRTKERSGIMNRKLSLLGWCVVSTNLTGLILLVIRVCRFYPCNHWAVDTRLAYAPAVAGLALAAAGLLRSRRIAGVWACGAVSLLLAVSVFLIDALNLLVDYHRWIERKMPVPWTWW